MDTRFWGPPGWKLLHQIAYKYPEKPDEMDKLNYGIFFSNLANILPCKYCRNSYSKYIKNLPIEKFLESREKLTEWLYLMHNKVNGKLRRQGFLNTPNPTLKEINERYAPCAESKCSLPGWDFIYAVVFNYSTENPAPSQANGYLTFFTYLGKVIPCEEYRKHFNNFIKKDPIEAHLTNQDSLIKWLYGINCKINDKLNEENSDFGKLCKFYQSFKAGSCKKKNHKGKTCRKKQFKLPTSKENSALARDNMFLLSQKMTKKVSKSLDKTSSKTSSTTSAKK